jgi:NTE family protein
MERALVLGGGSVFGSAWESGYLVGLAEAGVDTRLADEIVGTSAGSQVGAVLAGGTWSDVWARQVEPRFQTSARPPEVDVPALFERYRSIQAGSEDQSDWLVRMTEFAREPVAVGGQWRLAEIGTRLGVTAWPRRLSVVAVDTATGRRMVWTGDSGVPLVEAVASSCALPGVYPAVPLLGRTYCDGGIHSMENADLTDARRVLVLAVSLPIPTPFSLEDEVAGLAVRGAEVRVVRPGQAVWDVLKRHGGNAMDPGIRPDVAQAGRAQGRADAGLAAFWMS